MVNEKQNHILMTCSKCLDFDRAILKFLKLRKFERKIKLNMPESDTEKPFTILIVDDSKVSRNVIAGEFKNENFEVHTYASSVDALSDIEKINPDFIISDLEMGTYNGYELCQRIHQIEAYKDTPFVLISGSDTIEQQSQAYELNITKVFKKPFQKFEILKYVNHYLDLERGTFNYHTMIVEDDGVSRKVLVKILKDLKLQHTEVTNLQEATEALKSRPIDLIFLDNSLPDGKGIHWCKEFKSKPEYEHIPVLGISSDTELSLDFIHSGADDYLQKPFLKEEVIVRTNKELKNVAMRKELNSLIEKEKALNHQKNKLLGMAAHDIRNPISFIISAIGLIDHGKVELDARSSKLIEHITASAKNCLTLLDETLNMSSLEDGLVKLNIESFDMGKLLQEQIDQFKDMAEKKSISFKTENKCDSSEQIVSADINKITQVVGNLITNAIKYSNPETETLVSIDKTVEGLIVSIRDQGLGIPEKELPHIFEAFQKTVNQPTAGESSTGLGLNIVRKIVEAHNGSLWVESKVGEGSTFSFSLPI